MKPTLTAALLAFATAGVAVPAGPQLAHAGAPMLVGKTLTVARPHRRGPQVEVVFALDTTGSMSGLIAGAKAKIFSIANAITAAEPSPDIRFGLVGYRDRGDAYVVRTTRLSRDLDQVYGELTSFQAGGGGDGPEDVNAALREAIFNMPWSRSRDTLRIIYLVGDAPPHDDYQDQNHTSAELARIARQRGIIINAIQAGNAQYAVQPFQAIAAAAGGDYLQIDQSGGVQVIATPYDAELSRLNQDNATTMIGYGNAGVRHRMAGKRATKARMAAPAAADNAEYNARRGMGHGDVVGKIVSGETSVDKLDAKKLDMRYRKMSKKQRQQALRKAVAKRRANNKRIAELSKKRAAYIEKKRAESGKRSGFDQEVVKSLRKQSAKLKLKFK